MMKFIERQNFYMSHKFYTVDRIEEDTAVLYDREKREKDEENKLNIAVADLPENIKEGDILRFDEEDKTYTIDKDKTEQVKASIEERFKKLFKK